MTTPTVSPPPHRSPWRGVLAVLLVLLAIGLLLIGGGCLLLGGVMLFDASLGGGSTGELLVLVGAVSLPALFGGWGLILLARRLLRRPAKGDQA